MTSKFIVVRYAPGSGGKFIASLLQLSDSVNGWSENIDQATTTDQSLEYFKQHFKKPWQEWLKNEPEIPYQVDFVSNRFDRGNDIDFDQATLLLKDDTLFNKHLDNDKKIVLISNKSTIPCWLRNRASFVNLVINDKWALRWTHIARINKLFYEIEPNKYIIKQDHPDFCSSKRSVLASKFSNKIVFEGSRFSFLRQYIASDSVTKTFQQLDKIVEHESNSTVEQFNFNLSTMKFRKHFVDEFKQLCRLLSIQPISDDCLDICVDYYLNLHDVHDNDIIFNGESYKYQNKMGYAKGLVAKHAQYYGVGDQIGSEELDEFLSKYNDCLLVTDNKINVKLESNHKIFSLAPEFYGIHHMNFDLTETSVPDRAYACFINRICSVRQSWFYKLYDIGLDSGFVSFNIDHRDQPCSTKQEKLILFDSIHNEYNNVFEQQYNKTRNIVPYCNFDQTENIENVCLNSVISLVIETYTTDNRAIALSEKTFRALQLPRPFLLFAPMHTIKYLESLGFKITFDCINHDYDNLESWIDRQTAIIQQLEKFVKNFNKQDFKNIPKHWVENAHHNQLLLKKWSKDWDIKLKKVVDMHR